MKYFRVITETMAIPFALVKKPFKCLNRCRSCDSSLCRSHRQSHHFHRRVVVVTVVVVVGAQSALHLFPSSH